MAPPSAPEPHPPPPEPDASALAGEALFPLLYGRLYEQARSLMARQGAGHTLQATALVSELWLKLQRWSGDGFVDEEHFLSTAARAMRQIVVDHAKGKRRLKRDGQRVEIELDEFASRVQEHAVDLERFGLALEELEAVLPEMVQAVELRLFAGLPHEEIARRLGLSRRTYSRRWEAARILIYDRVLR